jgi:hypothetical protein
LGEEYLLALVGVLALGTGHADPSAQPPVQVTGAKKMKNYLIKIIRNFSDSKYFSILQKNVGANLFTAQISFL